MMNLPAGLTQREREVLELVVSGSGRRKVTTVLGISPRTVEFHRAKIMLKLSAHNIADLMRIVLERD